MNVRPPRSEDLQEVLALARAADTALIGHSDWTEADLRSDWRDADLDRDAWIVETGGRVAGYAILDDRGGGRMIVEGYVHPALRGAGVGTELLRITEARAREEIPTHPVGTRIYLQNATPDTSECTAGLYAAHGYVPGRHDFRMLIELTEAPAAAVPRGVEIRGFRQPEDARRLHRVLEDAWEGQRDHRRRSFEEWAPRVFDDAFDPTLCWVATEGEDVVGANVCGWKRYGDWGWVATLGVLPDRRGRGIGEALLRTAFAEFWRRGERRVALGVDAANPTGATRLYERVGMRVLYRIVLYEKDLRAA